MLDSDIHVLLEISSTIRSSKIIGMLSFVIAQTIPFISIQLVLLNNTQKMIVYIVPNFITQM